MSSFGTAKAPHNFLAKNITTVDFLSILKLNESLANDFVMLMTQLGPGLYLSIKQNKDFIQHVVTLHWATPEHAFPGACQ